MTDQPTINPGDWVRLGHTQHPDFRLEGTVHVSSPGYLALGGAPIAGVYDGLFYGYTILERTPAEPDWANDRAVVDGKGTLWVRDGVKWRPSMDGGVIGMVALTTAEVAADGPITRIDPRKS